MLITQLLFLYEGDKLGTKKPLVAKNTADFAITYTQDINSLLTDNKD